ncbi:phosphoenolpyruvate synthase [Candidatus Pacearchaeota archaeon]|nr:phosphoenolpyruvate synthase [Candidatus Pacearchaeota archaeon]
MKKEEYIIWLSSLGKKDVQLAGGKGANLGEMYKIGMPVPPAFVVTTKAFHYFLKQAKVEEKVKEMLNKIDVDDTADLEEKAREIRELIEKAEMPEDLYKEIVDSYDHFNIDLDGLKDSPGALAIMKSAREAVFVSVRSSATAEDLGDASFAGQQSSFINVKGNVNLIEHVKKVFASIFTARSIYYRKKKGFESFVGIAAVVQRMINSNKSGVIFSKDPRGGNENILIEAVFGQGEGIVSGRIKPDHYVVSRKLDIVDENLANKKIAIVRDASGITKTIKLKEEISKKKVLKNFEIKQLAEHALTLEEHYKKPQDIEFAIEDENIFILQTRPVTTLEKKSQKEGDEFEGQVLIGGLAASPGVVSGNVKIVKSMDDLDNIKQGDVLVTEMTNPDMVVTMQKASAIVTNEGGITAHAAIVSREMGIPAVVGTDNATSVLEDGAEVTVDGFNGKVFAGKAESKKVEILPIVETKMKIKVLVDLPEFAERAAKTKADGVGLVRLEGIIASGGKHPLYYEKQGRLDDYTKMLREGLSKISELFIGKEIWVRTSDIRSDEYANLEGAPKEIEKNPMLGNHGIRFSLKNKNIFKAELRAIKLLADKGHKFGLMFPQVISPNDVKEAKGVFRELGMLGNSNIKIGVMIETPAATILIKDICDEGIDFISFGTNDLTQYTLAVDRGNEDVQYLYDEHSWAVKKQISRVIRECRSRDPKVETSICGQAGSNKEMVEFLVSRGIDSISVNADVAKEISQFVQNLEAEAGRGSGGENDGGVEKVDGAGGGGSGGNSKIEEIGNKESVEEEVGERKEEFQKSEGEGSGSGGEREGGGGGGDGGGGGEEGDGGGGGGEKKVFDVFS